MIAYLKGQILKKTEKGIILDTGNVGYLVSLPANLLSSTEESAQAEFFIHSHIREDAFDLYGFENYSQLTFFKTLISVSGIGPKSGLEILSNDTDKIKAAILNEDVDYLCKIPGIGQKTAKRIILELKNKIEIETPDSLGKNYKSYESGINNDVLEALLKLGYQRHHINQTLRNLPKEMKEAEEIITYFLKNS